MAVPFRHPHRVSYAECTVGDHIYHSRYPVSYTHLTLPTNREV